MKSRVVLLVALVLSMGGCVMFDRTGPMTWPAPESFEPAAELPDPLVRCDGSRVDSAKAWGRRRAEIIGMMSYYQYGHMPPAPERILVENRSSHAILDGAATEHRMVLAMGPDRRVRMQTAVIVPTRGGGPFPVVVAIEPVWIESLRPVVQAIVDRGYAVAGFERHDLDADNEDRTDGVHPVYPEYDWASLSVWAWGCMRVVDHLETLDEIDPSRIVLTGHSRAGKTALWAGALDERIALVAPHASGAGGAASYRIQGRGSESLGLITEPERFHYWFHPRLREFAGREDCLPFDQHFLLALVGPRALLCMEGLDDHWANPIGTWRMYCAAQPVFDLLDAGAKNGIYFRPGGHDTTLDDWEALLDYADQQFSGSEISPAFRPEAFPGE